MKDKLKKGGWATAALCIVAAAIFGFYYWKTPAETVVLNSAPLPSGLSPGFSAEQVGSHLLASIQQIRSAAASGRIQSSPTSVGFQVATGKAPVYTSLQVALPIFDQKVRGISLGMLRQWAVSVKARRFVFVDTTAASGAKFRLQGVLQERPDFGVRNSWRVPINEEPCPGLDSCADELAEGVLAFLEPRPMVLYYLQKAQETAYSKIVSLYESKQIATDNLTRDDYLAWADALRGMKEYDRAINKYREGLERDKQFCSAHDTIGYTHLLKYQREPRMEHLNAAEQSFLQAVECNPKDAVAYCNLGHVTIRKWVAGKRKDEQLLQKAIEFSQTSLKLDAGLAEPAVNIGYLQYMSGHRQEALDYFRKIGQTFPKDAALSLNFGYLAYREYLTGRNDLLQDAIEGTRRASELQPKSWEAANNLGFLYFETDSLTQAVQSWEAARVLNSTDTDVLTGLALGWYKSGKAEEAIKLYREAMRRQRDGEDLTDPDYLQKVHFWSKKAAEAVLPLIQAAKTQP